MTILLSLLLFAAGPKDSISSTVIPFEKNVLTSPLVIVEGQLNGHNAYFEVDCGSETTILAKSQADVFGFVLSDDLNNSNVDWSGNSVAMSWADHAKIQIGNIIYKQNIHSADVDALLSNVSKRSGRNVIGILGCDWLTRNKLVIDFSTRSIHQ